MQPSLDYGTGADGNLVFDGVTAVTPTLGNTLTPSNGVYTLLRDLAANNVTIADGAVVYEAGFKLMAAGTCKIGTSAPPATTIASASNSAALPQGTINVASTTNFLTAGAAQVLIGGVWSTFTYTNVTPTSFTGCVMLSGSPVGTMLTGQAVQAVAVVHNNGNAGGVGSAGTGGAAGGATPSKTAGGIGAAGAVGGTAAVGAAGGNSAIGYPNTTGGSGTGGGDGTHAGGAAGTFTALAAAKGGAENLSALEACGVTSVSGLTIFGGGAGGGSGASDNADGGGGGSGSGGGVAWLAALNIINNGLIAANGGNGGNGFSTSHNAGGGGGGDGGVAIALSRTYSGAGFVTANGGLGGAKVGAAGIAGSAGAVGTVRQVAA
jgi:hypothetical protein